MLKIVALEIDQILIGPLCLFSAGTFNAGNRKEDTTDRGKLYMPSSKLDLGGPPKPEPQLPSSGLDPSKRPEKPGMRKKMAEKKKSNLEMFKEELKARQEERQERHRIKSVIRGEMDPDDRYYSLLLSKF